MSIAKKIYWTIPASIRRNIENIFKYSKRTNLANKIIKYYEQNKQLITPEIEEVLSFLKTNWVRPFPYHYKKEYDKIKVDVFYDDQFKLPYVFHNRNKMYFRKNMNKGQVESNYKSLLAEQDKRSPHRYLTSTFHPENGDIIIDVGAAEGIFALNNIENANKIYLIESNPDWVEATFQHWEEKVEIIGKYASDTTSQNTIALDDIYKKCQTVNFIKIDVEGYESKVIKGSQKIFREEKNLKINLCTYHKQKDGELFSELLKKNNFEIEFSKGFMLSIYPSESEEPYLRRGLIRAQKINN